MGKEQPMQAKSHLQVVDDDVGGDGGDVGVGVHGGDDGNGGDVFVDDDAYPRLPLTPFHSLGWFF